MVVSNLNIFTIIGLNIVFPRVLDSILQLFKIQIWVHSEKLKYKKPLRLEFPKV